MKLPRFPFLAAVATVLLFSACGSRDQATTPTTPPAESGTTAPSPATPFEKVMGRLDLGGKMLEISDHDGRREMVIGMTEMFLGAMPEIPRENLDVPALLDAFGVGRAAASGRSLRRDDTSWLLRSYTYEPKGRKGLETLLGNNSAPFLAPEMLPASVDFVVETRLDISAFPALVSEVAKAVGQEEPAAGFLKQEVPTGEVLLDLFGQSKLHLILGLDLSSWGESKGKRHLDFFVRLDGGNAILKSLQPEIVELLGEPEMVGKTRQWQFPLEALEQEPGLLLADEEGTLTLASTKAYLEAAQGSQGKLAADPVFSTATNHFPKSGNVMVYASPRFPPFLASLLREFALPQVEKEIAPLLAKATESLTPNPWSLCVAHEPDGTMVTAELPFPGDTDIASALPMLSATSVVFIGAKAWKDGSDRAGCVINIRNIQTALRSYQNMNELSIGSEIPWDGIIGPGKFLETAPVCPGGGTYTFAKTIPEVGGLGCRCSNPKHVPPSHAGW